MYTKEQISEEIKRVAEKLNVTALSEKDFKQNSTLPLSTIRYYMGSWSRALKEAGLDAASDKRADNAPRDDDELLMELLRLYNRYGETPTVSLVNEKGKFAYRYYGSRWKSLNEAFLLAKAKFPKKNVSMPQKTADKKVEEFPGLDPLPQTPVTNAADINIMPGEPNRDVDSMKPGNLNNMDTIHTMDTIDTKLDTMNPMGSMNTLETMDTMEAIDSLETLGMPDIPGTLEVPGIDPADALEVPEIDSTGAVDVLSEVPGSADSANVHDGDFQPTHIFLDEQEGKIAGEKQTAQTENKLKKMTEEFVADEDEETLSEIEPKDIIRRMMTPKPKTGEFSSNDVDLGDTIPTAPVNPADFSSNDVDLGDTMPTAAVNPGEFSSNDVDLGDTMPTA
ncbi:MAG: hypothetical protein GY757_10980, partial [bacterium]|nr:hypothetical protein [bacterium]